jgi:hypothetical protein
MLHAQTQRASGPGRLLFVNVTDIDWIEATSD